MKNILLATTSLLACALAFDNSVQPGWKKDADGNLILKDGNPVNVLPNGQEQVVGLDTITRLNGEARDHRTAKEAAEAKLEAFKGIDPEAARKAIDLTGKLDAKKLIDAGEVDKVRDEMRAEFTGQITEKDNALKDLQGKYDGEKINSVFGNSKFLSEALAVPRDLIENTYRNNFKIEDGKIFAYGKDGNKIFSKERAGEYADTEEALKILIESHPNKDVLIKADLGNGSGNGGGGGNQGKARTMKRAEFDALDGSKKAEAAAAMGKGELTVAD